MTSKAFLSILAFTCFAAPARAEFELAGPGRAATILVSPGEPECVRLAAEDLAGDVEKIAGQRPRIVARVEDCAANCVIVGTASRAESARLLGRFAPNVGGGLRGRWEEYRVQSVTSRVGPVKSALVVAGSDERGTMFGLYAFIEERLGVDPLYFWTDREPPKRDRLAWQEVRITGREPTFRYRGWFINDEDLLAEWKGGGGRREIDYPFYHQVTAPEVFGRVFEAMLRLQYNLVIPASFTDITNPAEERMVAEAVRRGLFVSMHHVEPMGVSAFAFQNYWRRKGREVPYSFVRHRAEFEETWRHFAQRWARWAPQVVWQLGLRGIADRPLWVTDPHAPQTDAARGKLISDAMRLQAEIVRSVDPRPQPPMTTTLWMEGAALNREGHLQFPPDVTVVFADNSPGWKWQADFYETKREAGRGYGVYYHHALWGSGPHLAQAVPPRKTHELIKEAVARGASEYAILNVSNVREFALGVDASARMLREFAAFDPDRFLAQWCAARFGAAAGQAEQAYRAFFASYVINNQTGTPLLLDGLTLGMGLRFLGEVKRIGEAAGSGAKLAQPQAAEWARRHIPDMVAGEQTDPRRLLQRMQEQRAALEDAGRKADAAAGQLRGEARLFFENNLLAQQRILLGLVKWAEAAVRAGLAAEAGERAECGRQLRAALDAFAEIRAGQSLTARGKWADWYRGDRKMNLARAEELTRQVAALFIARSSGPSLIPPTLFVIGDSISMQYGPHLEKYVRGFWQYSRKSDDGQAAQNLDVPVGANGGDSRMVLEYLRARLKDETFRPDVLLLNCGLHDIKRHPQTNAIQVGAESYRRNLEAICRLLQDRGVALVWVRTTPVDDERHNSRSKEFKRYARDLDEYNRIADAVMAARGVPVIDLHAFTLSLGGGHYIDHVHYDEAARALQAAHIAGFLRAAAQLGFRKK
jgi:hypothetical protein